MPPAEPEFLVKICGITNLDDALSSVRLGANALGFNFYPKSPRYLEPEQVEKILPEIPEHVLTVAVMVISGEDGLSAPSAVVKRVPSIRAFQLHGLHHESDIPLFEKPLFIATSPMEADRFPNHAILIDTPGAGERLKTGMTCGESTVLSSCREACGRGMFGKP